MSNTKTVMSQAVNTQGLPLDITDVFSTYLYTGNSSTRTITNGIDLDGEGGMTWIKNRGVSAPHLIYDTLRGGTSYLLPSFTSAAQTSASFQISPFNQDGFGISGSDSAINLSGNTYASWTFRKAPKFFDVVTYTGDGVAGREIAHNLGSVPGCFILKATSTTGDWIVYHRGLSDPSNKALALHLTNAELDNTYFNDTDPTATHFVVGGQGLGINNTGVTYVAYLFAHNDGDGEFGPDSDQDIIKCGSYTGNGLANSLLATLGFEPQWLLVKRTNASSDWIVVDVMRGAVAGGDVQNFYANQASAEVKVGSVAPSATGIMSGNTAAWGESNASGGTYIYIAIRRGPLAPPKSGTEVFGLNEYTGSNTAGRLITSSGTGVVDAAFINSSGTGSRMASRLTGIPYLTRNDTSAEINSNTRFENFDDMNGFFVGSNSQVNSSSFTYLAAMWTRAPGFFDAVAYTGDSTAGRTVSHNLGVAPEMMIFKSRSSNDPWLVYHEARGANIAMELNGTGTGFFLTTFLNSTTPSSSDLTLGTNGNVNGNSKTFIAYLFATLAGVSKVGSYTGNGSSQTINCGFTSGARYVLVKRTNTTGDWVEFNSAYGIVAGNEKAWKVNAGGDTGTSLDLIDPDGSGFIINQEASYNLNVNNSNYIFYAVA